MGTLDIGSFDNDDAIDWVIDLEESNDLSILQQGINPEGLGEDYDAPLEQRLINPFFSQG